MTAVIGVVRVECKFNNISQVIEVSRPSFPHPLLLLRNFQERRKKKTHRPPQATPVLSGNWRAARKPDEPERIVAARLQTYSCSPHPGNEAGRRVSGAQPKSLTSAPAQRREELAAPWLSGSLAARLCDPRRAPATAARVSAGSTGFPAECACPRGAPALPAGGARPYTGRRGCARVGAQRPRRPGSSAHHAAPGNRRAG